MEPLIGEIRLFAGTFAPLGWMMCWGQLLPISEYDVLFALIGTTYGGDGQSTFALPDLRGRLPVHAGTLAGGSTYPLGQRAGSESVTLTGNQIPGHAHPLIGVASPALPTPPASPAGLTLAQPAAGSLYASSGRRSATMAPQSIAGAGNSQPHDNVSPALVLNFIIAYEGIFPSQG